MDAWENGMLYTPLAVVNVYQCGSCRSYDDPDHWSYETNHLRSCGYRTEEEAQRAAEKHIAGLARSTLRIVKQANAERERRAITDGTIRGK